MRLTLSLNPLIAHRHCRSHAAGLARLLTLGLALVCFCAQSARAQYFTTIYEFTNTGDGALAGGTLTETSPGIFTGYSIATIFAITPYGGFKTVLTFDGNTQGYDPVGQLYPASDGLLYGANDSGNEGASTGSLFVANESGGIKVLQANTYFASPVIQASDGNLYGVTGSGTGGDYNIFRLTKTGVLTNIHSLGPNGQMNGPLMQASDGNLYGMTWTSGGSAGTIFRMSLAGDFTTLETFAPYVGGKGGLIQATNGVLYGVAAGTQETCPRTIGFIFALTLLGEFKNIYSQYSCYPVGSGPSGGLIEASDGNLYGVTGGGAFSEGSIFRLGTDGSNFTTLISLHSPGTGSGPSSAGASFVQGSDGLLYGTTDGGGLYNFGTIYKYDLRLPPPLPGVRYIQPASGAPGTHVLIAGTHLIGLTGVSFNGVPATQISSKGVDYAVAVVPPGATTGPVTVTTGNGSAASKTNFTVQ